jgi:hypothetical protein
MAMHDILIWKQQAVETLNGDVVVVFNNGVTPPTYNIQVTWNEPGLEPSPAQNYTIQIPVSAL